MPLYFFDMADGGICTDDEGLDFADDEAARLMAMKTLPAIAVDALWRGEDAQDFTILVRAEQGRPVYSGTLSYSGGWIGKHS